MHNLRFEIYEAEKFIIGVPVNIYCMTKIESGNRAGYCSEGYMVMNIIRCTST